MFYVKLKKRFEEMVKASDVLDDPLMIRSRVLTAKEAIGTPEETDYPILKGKEYLVEAVFRGAYGQAYTDDPTQFTGTLRDGLALSLDTNHNRCVFVATVNAVLRWLGKIEGTVHCKDEGPKLCAFKIAEFIAQKKVQTVGVIGLQPAILRALAALPEKLHIICLDRDEEFLGQHKAGVPIIWSDENTMRDMFQKAEVVLATGSTVVNGTLPDILEFSGENNVPVYFYGTTIAGVALLMELNRVCYNAT